MTAVLEADSVTKTYEVDSTVIRAVDDVSLQICPGEFVALVGPSGSGKTTMLAMLAGLLKPTQGSIMIGGRKLHQMSDEQRTQFRREKVGFTFQSNNLVPYLTVRENVELMLKLNNQYTRQSQEQTLGLLAQLGLGDRLNNLPSQLSGGQQQRVAIARALVHNPAIVLADEPTASLDTARALQVVQTFASLIHAQNLAGIMVTHDLRMCQFVDKIIQMQDGKIARVFDSEQEIRAFSNAHMLN
ncbi:MAG: ABC transporter ATP-binding protein [Anaerolineales bacterium]|nr:MAG: ABC transporter ATP-binding protein [Anaerolineales bacterium]